LAEFRKLAEQGVPLAQFALGQMHAEGVGVSRDYGEATKWYKLAAHGGLAQAQYNLGIAHYTGIGVRRDYLQAAQWYEKAARQGDARSQNNLGYLYESGKGVKQDFATSIEWYRLAAEGGNVNAQVNLGNAYRIGRGVEANHELAIAWLRKAVDKWETYDPLKLWIVESHQSIKPYSEAVGAGPAIRIAQDVDLLLDPPAIMLADEPVPEELSPSVASAEAAPVETVVETAVETVEEPEKTITVASLEAAPKAPTDVAPGFFEQLVVENEQLVVEVARLPETLSSPAKRQYDLVDDKDGKVSVSDGFRVQLGAFSNPENADRGWRELRDAHPDLLGEMEFDVSLHINKVDLGSDKGIVFRVQAGPFSEIDEARTLCSRLQSREVGCFLVRPQ
ncbi:MAG: SEL1-like repeat protein, partial [Proteobacteria bacterium]|nr:SEL1-like repeat protein [Pseudomonadota bacterium]